MMAGWFFFLWGLSGLAYTSFGPYPNEQACIEKRLEMQREVKHANHLSGCVQIKKGELND